MRYPVTILMYHAVISQPLEVADWCFVSEADFSLQMREVKSRFEIVSLREAAQRLQADAVTRPTAVVTFDDGFENNYTVAFPILREAGVPATIFVTTGYVGSEDSLWYCRLNWALATTRVEVLDWMGLSLRLASQKERVEASQSLQRKLKAFGPGEVRSHLEDICRRLDVDPHRPVQRGSPYRMLDPGQIGRMQESGRVEFGAHTVTHPILTMLTAAERDAEVKDSLLAIERMTGRPCDLFAYPNGRQQDFDEEVKNLLTLSGVRASVMSEPGVNSASTSLLELKRHGVGSLDADYERTALAEALAAGERPLVASNAVAGEPS